MTQLTIARPYAKAAFNVAKEDNAVAAWQEQLTLLAAVAAHDDVKSLLRHPQITQTAMADWVIDFAKSDFSEHMQHFIRLLVSYRRFNVMPEIFELFKQLRADDEKLADVKVVSAMPLQDAQMDALTKKLSQRFQRDVRLHCDVDANLIGGMVIRYEDTVLDHSVRTQLTTLHQTICS